jgi:hypothetical protein
MMPALRSCTLAVILLASSARPLTAQFRFWQPEIRVIDVIPQLRSPERNQDSEPFVTVNLSDTAQVALSAFTPSQGTCGANAAPIFVSSNGGHAWAMSCIVPSDAAGSGTGDITVRFAGAGGSLYAGILRRPALVAGQTRMNFLGTTNYLGPALMTVLTDRNNSDQPFIQAATAGGRDIVWVGNNDFAAASGRTASVDTSTSATAAAAAFAPVRVERRATSGQDGPPVRTVFHRDSTVYSVFLGQWQRNGTIRTVDVVVVRDDRWGIGAPSFSALTGGDGLAGQRVATGVSLTWQNASVFGQERLGPHASIAVSPQASGTLWVVWGDTGTTNVPTLHVRRSVNRGVTWDATDRRTIRSAINPSLAINDNGTVALVYQELAGTGAAQRWITHLLTTSNAFTAARDDTLSTTAANAPAVAFVPYLGDYLHVQAVGTHFVGTFSAANVPDSANFPSGITFLRNVNFASRALLDLANAPTVPASIDPFFFSFRYPRFQSICDRLPGRCDFAPLRPGIIELRCVTEPCFRIDPIDRNCTIKFSCPGCPPGGLCPGWYHFRFEDIADAWDVALIDQRGEPYAHELVRDGRSLVLSFRPTGENARSRGPRDYAFVFQRRSGVGRPDAVSNVRTSVTVSSEPAVRLRR